MMDQNLIVQPMFAMWALTFAVLIFMGARRIGYLMTHKIANEDVSTREQMAAVIPHHIHNASDNFQNLFEMPVVFYAVCVVLLITQHVDATQMTCAWIFVGARVVHSLVHCSVNIVPVRFAAYVTACIALGVMVVHAAVALLG